MLIKNNEKFKNIILSIFAFLLIVIGYCNFNISNKRDILEVASRNTINEINLGDVELVNSEPEDFANSGIVPNDNEEIENNMIDSKDYFTETKIERDKMYSETLETYQKMIELQDISQEQKAISIQEITNITNIKNAITISENLIKNKGFDDVVVLENKGNINVVVKSDILTQEQISKIQNIIAREMNVDINKINLSNR